MTGLVTSKGKRLHVREDFDYREYFKVHVSDIDYWGYLKPYKVLDLMQDISGVLYNDMAATKSDYVQVIKNYGWALGRYVVKAKKYPYWNDVIEIKSRRSPSKNVYDLREFIFSDKSGEEMIHGVGAWILINRKTAKPTLLNRVLPPSCLVEIPIEADFRKLPSPQEIHCQITLDVQYNDLDFNKHVNSSRYLIWATEVVPEDILKTHSIADMQIIYKRETVYGKKIISKAQLVREPARIVVLHTIMDFFSKIELARLKTIWVKHAYDKSRA